MSVGFGDTRTGRWNSLVDGFGYFAEMPIAGSWRAGTGGGSLTDRDPWNGIALTTIATAGVHDVEEAIAGAAESQRRWARRLPAERAAVMRRVVDVIDARHSDIARWLVRESGGTIGMVEVEVQVVRAAFREASAMTRLPSGRILASDIPGKENRVYRMPVGVVALIGPSVLPLYRTALTLAPALALGNAVVVKPSSHTPVTGGLLLARILEEAGLPAGVLSVVVGRGEDVGNALAAHRIPRVLSFTGSTDAAISISRVAGIKRLLLGPGGNAPLVVLDDADLETSVESALFGAFSDSGESGGMSNRVIVDETLFDEFVDAFVARAATLRVGDPAEQNTVVGPVISRGRLRAVQDKVRHSVDQGARLVLGGDPVGPAGLVLPPQVLVADNDVAAAREEVFGPVITLMRASGEAGALRLAKGNQYGLWSAVHTADPDRGVRFSLRLETAMTHINDSPVNDGVHVAPGGEKLSDLGRFGGGWSIDEFTTQHWVSVQHSPRAYPLG